MGLHFGELAKIRGIIYYKLSPHEQKPFANAFTHGLFNVIPRTSATILTWFPPIFSGIVTYYGIEELYRRSKRKNPKDFMDEVEPEE